MASWYNCSPNPAPPSSFKVFLSGRTGTKLVFTCIERNRRWSSLHHMSYYLGGTMLNFHSGPSHWVRDTFSFVWLVSNCYMYFLSSFNFWPHYPTGLALGTYFNVTPPRRWNTDSRQPMSFNSCTLWVIDFSLHHHSPKSYSFCTQCL